MEHAAEQISELVAQASEFAQDEGLPQSAKTALDYDFFPTVDSVPAVGFKDLREALGLDTERTIINLQVTDHPWRNSTSWLERLQFGMVANTRSNYLLMPTHWAGIYALFETMYYECACGVNISFVRASDEWFSEKLREFEATKSEIPFELLLISDPEVLARAKGMRDLYEERRPAHEAELRRIDEIRSRRLEEQRLKEERRNRNPFVRLNRFLRNL